MTNRFALLVGLLVFASSSAIASDTRIKTVFYDPDEIIDIVGQSGIQLTIQFGSDERIENVAVGDSAAWQVTPNRRGSLLFVKPISYLNRTNMTVVTDKRTYMFDLRSGGKSAQPLYSLKFSYPDLPPAVAAPTGMAGVTLASAPPDVVTAPSPESLNFDWKIKGSAKVRPGRIFDDGTSLFLAWPDDVQLPAILTSTAGGREAPLDYRMSGEYIVLSPVPQNIVLRHGKNVASAWTTARAKESITTLKAAPAPQSDPMPDRITVRTVYASRISNPKVKTSGAADLLSDNLTDDQHDH